MDGSTKASDLNETCHRLGVPNKRGQVLACALDRPERWKQVNGKNVVVLFSHGLLNNANSSTVCSIAGAVREAGFACCRFDSATTSTGQTQNADFTYGGYNEDVEDLQTVVEALHDGVEGLPPLTVACLLGHSKGGNNIILHAARYQAEVPIYISVSGRFHMDTPEANARFSPEQLATAAEQGYFDWKLPGGTVRVTTEGIAERAGVDMQGEIPRIHASTKILVLHGTGDDVIPLQDAKDMAELLGAVLGDANVTTTIVPEADHVYKEHRPQLSAAVTEFLAKVSDASFCDQP